MFWENFLWGWRGLKGVDSGEQSSGGAPLEGFEGGFSGDFSGVVLRREELAVILSELILYARRRLYSKHTRVADKGKWARVLRESVSELQRLVKGEEVDEKDLALLFSRVPKKVVRLLEGRTRLSLRGVVEERAGKRE